MAGYNPTSRRLTRQKAHRKDAIKRSSDSYWDIATAGKTAYAVADTANAVASVASSYTKLHTAITPTKQAYEEANIGRQEVGLEPLEEPSMWDLFSKKGPDVSEKETLWTDMETAETDATAVKQQGYEYSIGELKRIGQEVKSGTAKDTLLEAGEGKTWQDIIGTDVGTRDKPRPEQFGKKDDVVPSVTKETSPEVIAKDPNKKSTWDMLGKRISDWWKKDDKSVESPKVETSTTDIKVSQDTPDPNTSISGDSNEITSTTEDQIVHKDEFPTQDAKGDYTASNDGETTTFPKPEKEPPPSRFGDESMLAKYKGDRMAMYLGENAAFDETLNPSDYAFGLSSGVGSSNQSGGIQEYSLYNISDPENTIDYGNMFSVDTSNQFMGQPQFENKNASLFANANQPDSLWGDMIRDKIYR